MSSSLGTVQHQRKVSPIVADSYQSAYLAIGSADIEVAWIVVWDQATCACNAYVAYNWFVDLTTSEAICLGSGFVMNGKPLVIQGPLVLPGGGLFHSYVQHGPTAHAHYLDVVYRKFLTVGGINA